MLDPNDTIDFELATERSLPSQKRKIAVLRFMTCREVLAVARLINAARDAGDQEKENELLNQALDHALVGWKNVHDRAGKAIAFARENFDDAFTPREKWLLCADLKNATSAGERLKKPLGSSPPAASAPSVPAAAADDAATSPQKPSL